MKEFVSLLRLILPEWKSLLLAALLGFLTIASNAGLMGIAAFLIASAALQPPVGELMLAIVGVRFCGLGRAVFRYLDRYCAHDATFRVLSRLRTWFYRRLEPLAPAGLVDRHSGELLSSVVADIQTLEHFYLRVMAPPVVALLVLAAGCLFLAGLAPEAVPAFLGFFLAGGLVVPLVVRALGRGVSRYLPETRAELEARLVDVIHGMRELLVFDQIGAYRERVAALDRRLVDLQGRMAALDGLAGALVGLTAHLAALAVLASGIILVTEGKMAGVYLPVLALVVAGCFEAVAPLPLVFTYLEGSLAAARRLFTLADSRPAVPDPAAPAARPERYDLCIEGLRFRYGPEEPWVLDRVSFSLPEGKRVAVVGPSGAGKTTLVKLLLRFWDYEEGSIRLGGRELKTYAADDIRTVFSVVSQRTHVFNATIRENLLLAKPGASEEEIVQAAREARIDDFIRGLPDGYATCVGDKGCRLSGGERQRLVIARALLKVAPILVLDEPTAGLDPVTAREIMADIYRLTRRRTALIITHFLVGLENVDEIVVLDRGRVVERGRHEVLLQRRGLYHRMWATERHLLGLELHI